MTKQAIVDRVFEWFVAEGNPSSVAEDGTVCMYRGNGGERCAVGLFLTEYRDSFEFENIYGLMPFLPQIEDQRKESAIAFWDKLQDVHDHATQEEAKEGKNFLDEFVPRLRGFCTLRKLIYPGDQR